MGKTLTSLERELAKLKSAYTRSRSTVKPPAKFLDFLPLCSLQVESGEWVPFSPWPEQKRAGQTLEDHRLNVWLKARQLGMTWLALARALHVAMTSPGCTVLLFSRRDVDAVELLARTKGMGRRLPLEIRPTSEIGTNTHAWALSNGSRILAFPTTAGDSYTAKFAIIDEADLVPDLDRLMGAVKPTIDAGGSMLLLSRPDKSKPNSLFKQTYLAAKAGVSGWHATFLPWNSRPDRDAAWYEEQKRDVLGRTGSLDRLREQYPATDDEALAPNQLDKRIPVEWVVAQSHTIDGKPCHIPCLIVFEEPKPERRYGLGGDPAEGNPTSDESSASLIDLDTGVQVAVLAGRIQPTVFAEYIAKACEWYNKAPAMIERNNHGHAVIAACKELGVRLLTGHDGREGWLSSGKGKVLLYDACTEALQEGQVIIRDVITSHQLMSIEGATLRAPDGQHDDRADGFALSVQVMNHPAARRRPVAIGGAR